MPSGGVGATGDKKLNIQANVCISKTSLLTLYHLLFADNELDIYIYL